MTNTAISVQGLGKQYIIGHKKQGNFRHAIGDKIKSIFRPDANDSEVFWALRDINFEIKHGEAVGIIGRNGAGKSTLLKVLSRITDPSTGRFEINGRVSSLLEVGTGFHSELTGRENIYLNGTILGMKRTEIKQKFDEIVDFSGVEKFLDTPVKHYSSGMKVRLAFSVAAHLEPEILIVDEVLAVGDAEFQKKCLGKMDQVSKNEGRTVLFVSHNMGAVSTLTDKCLLLNGGNILMNDITQNVINKYLENYNNSKIEYQPINKNLDRPHISFAKVITNTDTDTQIFGEKLIFEFHLKTNKPIKSASFSFQVIRNDHVPVMHLWTFDSEREMCREAGTTVLRCVIDKSRLYLGRYYLNLFFTGPPNGEKYDIVKEICGFEVEMINQYREFSFQPNTCTYIEDSKWEILNNA